MKKIIFLLMAVLGMNIAIAQTPEIVIVRYKSNYSNLQPTWTVYDCYYRAEYMDNTNNTLRAVVYDKAGYVISNDWKMYNNYPTRISDYYRAVYPNEGFAVWSSLDERNRQSYYIIRNSEKIWFDRNGKAKSPVCVKS